MNNRHAYVLAGVRTPFGRLNGQLSDFSALDLGVMALRELGRRHPIASASDGAILGMVMQAGQGVNPARTVMYRSGIGREIPSNTLNSACLASIDSVIDATRRVERSEGSLYVVGGFDSSTRAPMLEIDRAPPVNALHHETLTCRIGGETFVKLSDRKNADLGISRERQDEWALLSQQRAAVADFLSTGELFKIQTRDSTFERDEGIRPSSSIERLSSLAPVGEHGTITAGNASQVADGASVGLVGSIEMAERMNTEPLARVVAWGYSSGPDNTLHLQPAKASRALLAQTDLRISDIDLWEINEAFASVVLATMDDLQIPSNIVNPNGGAIALGHPNGATAFRLVLTLAHELKRRNLTRGIATMCGGGGQGIALLIENVSKTKHL